MAEVCFRDHYCPFKMLSWFQEPLKIISNLGFHLDLLTLSSHSQLWQLWAATFSEIRNFYHISSEFLLTISSSHLSALTISVSFVSAWFLRQYAVHPFIKSQESHDYLETDGINAETLLWDIYFLQVWLR